MQVTGKDDHANGDEKDATCGHQTSTLYWTSPTELSWIRLYRSSHSWHHKHSSFSALTLLVGSF